VLVVGVNADASVRKLNKGAGRPVNREGERAQLIAGLACVDYVNVFREHTPIALIKLLKPHVHVKGGDYRAEKLPEYKAVTRLGGRVEIVALLEGKSTRYILWRIGVSEHGRIGVSEYRGVGGVGGRWRV
jgi:rfaE bifunctional protein nucleotidyltransferase chain/domain